MSVDALNRPFHPLATADSSSAQRGELPRVADTKTEIKIEKGLDVALIKGGLFFLLPVPERESSIGRQIQPGDKPKPIN